MAQKKHDNQDYSNDITLVKVPVRINQETLDDFRRLNPTVKVEMIKIGGWSYPCAIYWLPEGEADGFLTAQQTEAKREQREARCLLPDGKGGRIRCDEKNKCWQCPRIHSYSFDNGHPTSLDALHQVHAEERENYDWTDDEETAMKEPETCDGQEDDEVYTDIMLLLIDRLTAIRPKYGLIFKELLKGNVQPLNIAKALGLGKSQIYDDVPKVQKAAKRIYFELKNR